MIEVARFDTRADAELARSLLAAAGIPCILAPDGASGAYPVGPLGGARLLVAEADAVDAAEILGP
jgi:Putative prokaryotic signal transducing protein